MAKGLHAIAATIAVACSAALAQAPPNGRPLVASWTIPDADALPDDAEGRLIRFGRSLFRATPAHLGPKAADPSQRFAGNNLACGNCHLEDGRKKFGLPVLGAFVDYPQYSDRSGRRATIEDRVNDCMERSLNGRALPLDSGPMRALAAYLKLLSSGIPDAAQVVGAGAGAMPELARPADPQRGRAIYGARCALCHGPDGAGEPRDGFRGSPLGYVVPPLWGPDSFNDGAGSNRLITLANFVHDNMPNGVMWLRPALGVEEAWDVAAFVVSQPRPRKADLDRDFPDRLLKPVDAPYGPYADGFGKAQHKYGPFAPIRARIEELRAAKR